MYDLFRDDVSDDNVNIIMNLSIFSEILCQSVKCSNCNSQGLKIQTTENIDLCSEMIFFCESCDFVKTFVFTENARH